MKIYLFLKFHLAYLYRQHVIVLPLFLLSTLAMLVAASTFFYWAQKRGEMEDALKASLQIRRSTQAIAATSASSIEIPNLPEFSSAKFIDEFLSVAKDVKLTVDEVSYSLETGKAQPYWRYRIALKVQSGYPTIRRFLAALSSELPNVVLDGVRCDRENSAVVNLTCELSLSALFRRSDRG